MKLKPVAIAVAAGLALSLTGCSPRPDYTGATISSFNPWQQEYHSLWVVDGTSVEVTGTYPGNDGQPQTSSSSYELRDKEAFYKALHRALNAKQSICMDATEYSVNARDEAGVQYGNSLHQCDDDNYVSDLLDALDDGQP